MGLLNQKGINLPTPLDKDICPVCDAPMKPMDIKPAMDGYEYCCKNCNENVVIMLSRDFIMSSHYHKFRSNTQARKFLHEQIMKTKELEFPILTTTVPF